MVSEVGIYPKHVATTSSQALSDNEDGSSGMQDCLRGLLVYSATAMSLASPLHPGLRSALLPAPHQKLCLSLKRPPRVQQRQRPTAYPSITAVDLDQNTIIAITVGVVSVGVGLGIPIFYETQIDNAAKRDNTQPCFPCTGSGAQKCRFCSGSGSVTVVLGGGESEVSQCINCEGAGTLTCTTCQGTGIQPRYLDRREFKDDD